MNNNLKNLVEQLKEGDYLKTPKIIDAFLSIDRMDFVPTYLKKDAYLNIPLPIGAGQTISQPLVVAFMLELLEPKRGDKILDVGAGSGWTAALLAYIVSLNPKSEIRNPKQIQNAKSKSFLKAGKIFAIERIPELCEFGKENVEKFNFIKNGIVKYICGDGTMGLENEAPFDRILAGAAGEKIPEAWKRQLKIGGRIVAPVNNSIIKLDKINGGKFKEKEFSGFSFVPLVT